METEACVNWESLIAERSAAKHDTYKPQRIEDASKRNRALRDSRRDATPERKAYKRKYREEHRDELNAKKREYNATPEGKRKNHEQNKKWREANREYDRERKRAWWHKTHPNPKPIGRPRKSRTEVANDK